MPGQPIRHPGGVGALLTDAQWHGLDASQSQPGLLRAQVRPQELLALPQIVPGIGRARHYPGHYIAVSGEVLGGRVHHIVGTHLGGTQQVRRGKGAVHHEAGAEFMRESSERWYVGYLEERVRDRLADERRGALVGQRGTDLTVVGNVHETVPHAKRRQRVAQQGVRRPIDIGGAYHASAGAGPRAKQRGVDGGHPRRVGDCVLRALERSHSPLEGRHGWTPVARVDETGLLASKDAIHLFRLLVHVSYRRVDRCADWSVVASGHPLARVYGLGEQPAARRHGLCSCGARGAGLARALLCDVYADSSPHLPAEQRGGFFRNSPG